MSCVIAESLDDDGGRNNVAEPLRSNLLLDPTAEELTNAIGAHLCTLDQNGEWVCHHHYRTNAIEHDENEQHCKIQKDSKCAEHLSSVEDLAGKAANVLQIFLRKCIGKWLTSSDPIVRHHMSAGPPDCSNHKDAAENIDDS